jgi:hypothetical protein
MTQFEIEAALNELNSLVLAGKLMDAFEKYYHNDVQMQKNDLPPTVSKEANRQREQEFLRNVTDFRKAEVKGVAVSGNVAYVIWHYDYTHKEWGVRNYSQVNVQEWKDGKIIKEKFIYLN